MKKVSEKVRLYSTSEVLLFFLKNSPLWLLSSLSIGFILSGIFLYKYYLNYLLNPFFEGYTLGAMSLLAAIMFQLLRFSFALSGSADHASGNETGKRWGFAFSGFITLWELVEVYQAVKIMTDTPELAPFFWSLYMFVFAVILFPYVAEIRLTLQLADSLKKERIKQGITGEDGKKEFKKLDEWQRMQYLQLVFNEFQIKNSRKPSLRELGELIGASTTMVSTYLKKIKK